MAWALRAAGVPVWHDQSDLPPGDTDRRLAEALESGLSGAVLLITGDIENSTVVRDVELPLLLELTENETFTLSVLSTLEAESGQLDYDAPDRLLRKPAGTLKQLNQKPVGTPRERADAARAHCKRRMQDVQNKVAAVGGVITIDVQTRIPPVTTSGNADLVVRLRPPINGDRRPHRDGLHDLKLFLAHLPQTVELAGAKKARVRGGAHLSVAYALGAALPTPLIGCVEVVDTAGDAWVLTGQAPTPDGSNQLLTVESISQNVAGIGAVLVYLDLLPTRRDSAFNDLLSQAPVRFTAAFHVRPSRDGNLKPEQAAAITGEAAQVIRNLAGQYEIPEVQVLLRCPWTLALLLGRTLNTIRVHLYEWEDGPDDNGNTVSPRYLPSLVVRSGAGGSPIEHVTLPIHKTE